MTLSRFFKFKWTHLNTDLVKWTTDHGDKWRHPWAFCALSSPRLIQQPLLSTHCSYSQPTASGTKFLQAMSHTPCLSGIHRQRAGNRWWEPSLGKHLFPPRVSQALCTKHKFMRATFPCSSVEPERKRQGGLPGRSFVSMEIWKGLPVIISSRESREKRGWREISSQDGSWG